MPVTLSKRHDTDDLRTAINAALDRLEAAEADLEAAEADRDKLATAMRKAVAMLEVDDGSDLDSLNRTADQVLAVLRKALGGDR